MRCSKIRRLNDFLIWPISKRLFGNSYNEIVNIGNGIRMIVYGDMADMVNKTLMFVSEYMNYAWEPATSRLLINLPKKYNSIVIAGSHIGYYPLIMSKFHPNSRIYAFEPNPFNYERLNKNIEINSIKNITTEQHALGNTTQTMKMNFDFGQSSLINSKRNFIGKGDVSVIKLDEYFSNIPDKPDLMILDAEGYEMNIIKGSDQVIKNSPDIIFEINPSSLISAGSSPDKLCEYLINKGYEIYIIEDDYSHTMSMIYYSKPKLNKYTGKLDNGFSFVNAFATKDIDLINYVK